MTTNLPADIDTDAILWSAPSPERDGRPLLIMMHGWSYDETHLFSLHRQLPSELVVASLRAPFAEAGGYAWFPSRGNPIGDPRPQVANDAALGVLRWFTSLPSTFSSVGLLGFSQGGAMVLQLMRQAPRSFSYGLQLAGFVVDDTQPGDAILAQSKPDVFWGRGANDRVIPKRALERTATWMSGHTTTRAHVFTGLGHDVAGAEVVEAITFVADRM